MCQILNLPDIRPAGYPADLKAGDRISGRISGNRIQPDIRLFVKKKCSVSNKSLLYCYFLEDTGTVYEE